MSLIFLSYRRVDSADATGRIYDRLMQLFGQENIFKDVDSIPVGADFKATIVETVTQCDVVLVIMGRNWLNVVDKAGRRRLDNPKDAVRIEIEAALENDKQIIPIFVQNATMPSPDRLPGSLRELSFRNGFSVRPDPDFHRDMDRLIRLIGPLVRVPFAREAQSIASPRITELSTDECESLLKLLTQLNNHYRKLKTHSFGCAIAAGAILGVILVLMFGSMLGASLADAHVHRVIIAFSVILLACLLGPLPVQLLLSKARSERGEIEQAIAVTKNAIVEIHPEVISAWGGRRILDDPAMVQEKMLVLDQIVNKNSGFKQAGEFFWGVIGLIAVLVVLGLLWLIAKILQNWL